VQQKQRKLQIIFTQFVFTDVSTGDEKQTTVHFVVQLIDGGRDAGSDGVTREFR